MRFELERLQGKNLGELKDIFSSISLAETQVELAGHFNPTSRFGKSTLAESLAFLPRHIAAVKFSGTYVYTHYRSYEIQVGTRRVMMGPGNEWDAPNMETVFCYRRGVGTLLEKFILSLPISVNTLLLDFKRQAYYEEDTRIYNRVRVTGTSVADDFKHIFQNLPSHIVSLSLSGTDLAEENAALVRMFEGVSSALKEVNIGLLALGRRTFLEQKSIYSAINRAVLSVNLSNNELGNLEAPFVGFFEGLPEGLEELSLGDNHLGRRSREDLQVIFRELPNRLIRLRLNGNGLSNRSAADVAAALSCLPATLREVDLGENGLLTMSVADFTTVLTGLLPTINTVRLCEGSAHGLSAESLGARFACIRASITTLSVRGSNLLGLSVADFILAISRLPVTIDTLDLSENALYSRSPAELLLLFSNLPARIKTIKLHGNALSSLDAAVVSDIFALLPKTIETMDLRSNGFDRVLHTRLNDVLDSMPDIKLMIETDKLGIRNDGALAIYSPASHPGLFKPAGPIRHQKKLAGVLLVLGQLMLDKHLNIHVMQLILSMFWERVPTFRVREMVGKIERATTLISAKPPAVITPATEMDCRRAVDTRVSALTVGGRKLDLSHCGLNRLDEVEKLAGVFKLAPRTVNSLSLRSNGFSYTEANRRMLIHALRSLPSQIKYLDLSGNGFEQDDGERLAALFSRLPATVEWVSLSHEKAASPREHIEKRRWPASYRSLTTRSSDKLMQARFILDDYTKGDSAVRRFFYGHWNRHHAKEVAHIVKAIDAGRITDIKDVLSELELIEVLNPTGSLTRRVAFLFKVSFERAREERVEALGGLEGLEMRRPLLARG